MAARRQILRLNSLHPIAPTASSNATHGREEAAAGGSAKRQSEAASESGSEKRQREAAAGSVYETVETNSTFH